MRTTWSWASAEVPVASRIAASATVLIVDAIPLSPLLFNGRHHRTIAQA
jgi:hypothetical protein